MFEYQGACPVWTVATNFAQDIGDIRNTGRERRTGSLGGTEEIPPVACDVKEHRQIVEPARTLDPLRGVDMDGIGCRAAALGEASQHVFLAVEQHDFVERGVHFAREAFELCQEGHPAQELRNHHIVAGPQVGACGRQGDVPSEHPAVRGSSRQRPIRLRTRSTSRFSARGCSSTCRRASVDLPHPGGPLSRLNCGTPRL